ncbi:acyltransferase family protein [Asticcacaulis solisilvae]|uniref:acyltransferase family protein n=1 Tax=Asticcacaulis solisilvae TaxID=1217274 RepID=UPI003FD84DA0
MAGKYIGSLTAMRGVAALWVMLFHIDVSLFYRDMGALISRDATGILSKGYLWVDFFFILSGFIIAHVYAEGMTRAGKGRAVADYLWARVARVYPLHLFCLGLVVLIALTYPLFLPGVQDGSWKTFMAWKAIPSNLLMTHAMNQHVYLSWDIVSWSIGAEWWTYVATLPLLLFWVRMPGWSAGLTVVVTFACLAGLVAALPDKNLDITFNWGFFRCLSGFVIGMAVWKTWKAGALKWAGHDLVLVVLLAGLAAAFHFKTFGPYGDLMVVPAFALLVVGLAHNSGAVQAVLNTKPLQYLGRISYSLYLVHGVAFSAFWFLMPWAKAHLGVPTEAGRWLYAAGFIAIVVVVSHLTYAFVERPARLFLLGLRRERPHGAI